MNATYEDWKRAVEKELAGAPFDKKLVSKTAEGVDVQPLYVEGPSTPLWLPPRPSDRFRVCTHWGAEATADALARDVADGADALWLDVPPGTDVDALLVKVPAETQVILEGAAGHPRGRAVLCAMDPLTRGGAFDFAPVVKVARAHTSSAVVSTLPYHDAGADAALELGLALATGVAYFDAFAAAGIGATEAAGQMHLRVAVGADTFGELCKLRALRLLWHKLLAAYGVSSPAVLLHAVSAVRTQSARDPWVNMLRATTQVFAAVLGGADLVTASRFDGLLESPGALGKRIARNTGLVLREESMLGLVQDPAAGSYYLDQRTDALARAGWQHFQTLVGEGGVQKLLESGALASRLEASWNTRLAALRTRKQPVLGVSEFANVDETLPSAPRGADARGGLPVHRDAEVFEALRARAERTRAEVHLHTVGSFAESRARVGFASSFFAAGGLRARESSELGAAAVACLCGSDERYAAEAADAARALKAAGCKRLYLAGRPGELEAELRHAGVDDFLYVGCDAVRLLEDALETVQ